MKGRRSIGNGQKGFDRKWHMKCYEGCGVAWCAMKEVV